MDDQRIPTDPSALWEFYSKGNADPVSLWLDCDTGHDDAFAILVGTMHPAVSILGISTVHGNASLEDTTYNTRAILESIGRRDVPVYPGTAKPFCRAPAPAEAIHGRSGLDGTTVLSTPVAPAQTDKSAIEAMYHALKSCPPQSAWLVATGALTNVAILFLLHPDLVSHIAGLSIMGGVVGGGFTDAKLATTTHGPNSFGNWTPYAEFNIFCDPEAAQSIFSNPVLAVKTTLIPLDLSHLVLATADVRTKLFGNSKSTKPSPFTGPSPPLNDSTFPKSAIRPLFHEILAFFTTTYATVFGLTAGPPLHDPLAVVAVFVPALFDDHGGERWTVDVVREDVVVPAALDDGENGEKHGEGKKRKKKQVVGQCGRTVVRKIEGGAGGGVRIPKGVDVEAFWELIDSCLERAEDLEREDERNKENSGV